MYPAWVQSPAWTYSQQQQQELLLLLRSNSDRESNNNPKKSPLSSSTWFLDLNVLLNFDHRFCNLRLDSSTSFILPQLRLQTDSSSIFHLILRPNFSQLRLEILRSSISFFDLSLFFASWFLILSSSTWFFELRFFLTSPQILCDPPLDSSSSAGWDVIKDEKS